MSDYIEEPELDDPDDGGDPGPEAEVVAELPPLDDPDLARFHGLRSFVVDAVPRVGATGPRGAGDAFEIPPRVKEARDLALVSAYRAMARYADRLFDPIDLPFGLDVRAGGGG